MIMAVLPIFTSFRKYSLNVSSAFGVFNMKRIGLHDLVGPDFFMASFLIYQE